MLQVGVMLLVVGGGLCQYGGGGGHSSPVAPQPVVQTSCWTEKETVWDTQYVDTTTMECQPVTKKVPQRVSRTVPKRVCDDGGSYGVEGGNFVSQPRDQAGSQDNFRLRTGAASDAVNFGRK